MVTQDFTESFTRFRQDLFLHHIRQGMRRGAACDVVYGGDDPVRRRNLREFIAENQEFEAEVLDAEVEATENVEEALYQAAISGSVPAAAKWLELKGVLGARKASTGVTEPQRGPIAPVDPFADLDNVTPIDPRRRRQS